MRDRRTALDSLGVTVVVIGFERQRRLRGYCRGLKLGDWPCLVDESLAVYHAYGLGRLPWWRTFTPAAVWGYLKLVVSRRPLPRPRADIFQAGGDFVVDPDGRLALIHPGRGPHDRPSVQRLLATIGAGGEQAVG